MSAGVTDVVKLAARYLVDITHAEAVVLFGSRARGEMGTDSDWDLCVILPDDVHPNQFTAASLWQEVSAFGLPIQVYPVRRSVFIEALDNPNSVSHDVLKEGLLLVGDLERVVPGRGPR